MIDRQHRQHAPTLTMLTMEFTFQTADGPLADLQQAINRCGAASADFPFSRGAALFLAFCMLLKRSYPRRNRSCRLDAAYLYSGRPSANGG